jgi:hypothetical protein
VRIIQLLTPIAGQILGSLAILIFFGIIMEKRYVSWWSVGGNALRLILTFSTLDLAPSIIIVLFVYASVGIACAIERWERAYFFFGSKTYGSALLVLGLFSIRGMYNWLNYVLVHLGSPSLSNFELFLISWLVIAITAHIVCWYITED